jgi:hypothetical protein
MADYWPQTVAIPPTSSYGPTPTDFSWLSKLPQQHYQGQADQLALAQKKAFSDGLPTNPDGSPNYGASATKLLTLGDYADANTMMQTGINQQAMANQAKTNSIMSGNDAGTTSAPPGTAGSPVRATGASGAAANPSSNYDGLNPFLIQNGQKENNGSFRIDTGNGGGVGQFIPGTWDMLHQMRPILSLPR